MTRTRLDVSAGAVVRRTLAGQVEAAMRSAILSGELEPGQRLTAADLTIRFGVSATPLREALQHLAAQHLIDLGPRLGARVAELSGDELKEIYGLRRNLEGVALERAIRLGDAAWEQRVQRSFIEFARNSTARLRSASDAHAWSAAHRAFHDATIDACGSPWLLRFTNVLSDHSERYQLLSRRRGARDTVEEHRDILVATIARDPDAAQDALRRHLDRTVQLLEEDIPRPAAQ